MYSKTKFDVGGIKYNCIINNEGTEIMGRAFVEGIKELDELELEDWVSMHFQSNCYPPIPQFMVQSAVAAIVACNKGDYNEVIELPMGVTYRDSEFVDAWTFVEQHRLEGFVEWEYED